MLCKTFWAIVLIFIIEANLCAWWPVYKFPAVEGVVIDSTTAKPIENVLVECGYRKSIGVLIDNMSKDIGSRVAITGKDGKYSIPNKIGMHLLPSWFPLGGAYEYEMCFQFNHPFYEFDLNPNLNIFCWNAYSDPPSWAARKVDGTVVFNVTLASLDEKYVKPIKNLTDKERILLPKYREIKEKFVFSKVSNLSQQEIKTIDETYNSFRKQNERLVQVEGLIDRFEGNVGSQIDAMLNALQPDGEPAVAFEWDEIIGKYEEYMKILSEFAYKHLYKTDAEQFVKLKGLISTRAKKNDEGKGDGGIGNADY